CRSPRDHVPPCGELETETSQAVVQARVANRGGAHVPAAATGAQVERPADDGALPLVHGEKANQPLARSVSLTARTGSASQRQRRRPVLCPSRGEVAQ